MSQLDLHIERAVAGGRMLSRHEGVVVLVAGAIPGERVRVEVEKATSSVMWARVVEVLESHPGRRPASDQACGGMAYAHMAYPDQVACKREVILDAFRRIGRTEVPGELGVAPSPERGYRLRARLHVAHGRAGFFRTGTHTLCDASATGQLHAESVPAVERVLAALGRRSTDVESAIVAENVAASQRVVHLEGRAGVDVGDLDFDGVLAAGLTGVTASARGRIVGVAGAAHVTDSARDLVGGGTRVPADTTWTRQAASFFQGNRFLTGALVRHVLDRVTGDRVADLYAGVGLFAVALAATGRRVVAVEGDRTSGRDLDVNATPFHGRVRVVNAPVERAARELAAGGFDTVVLDPPRTGVSTGALAAVLTLGAPTIVYVSCDPATLARDSVAIRARGYTLMSVDAFDFFPNTAHVETVALFTQPEPR